MSVNPTPAASGSYAGGGSTPTRPGDPLAQLAAAQSAWKAAQDRRLTADGRVATALANLQTAQQNVQPGTPVQPDREEKFIHPTLGEQTRTVPGTPATPGTGEGEAQAALTAYQAAVAEQERAITESDQWLKETQRLLEVVRPLTPQEAQAFADQSAANQLDLQDKRTRNAVDALELEIAQAEQMAQGTPEEIKARQAVLDDLAVRKGAADIAQSRASEASSLANAAATAASTVTENALRQYVVRSAAAGATSDESQATIDAARALYAEDLARLDVELQELNITWQEYNNQSLLLKNDFEAQLLAAGMPQIEIDQALATLKGTDIANQQLSEGEIVTRLTQMRDAIANDKMTVDQANQAAYDLQHGSTEMQRQQQVDANTQTAIQQAAAGGYLVGPGQNTTDHFGLLGSTFDSLGLSGQSKQPIHPQAPPEFLQSTGQMSTAQRTSDTFAPDGSYYGANGVPAFLDASKGLAMGPDEWEQMKGAEVVEKVEANAAAKAPEEAAAAAPVSTGAGQVVINIGSGDPANNTPPPPASVGQKQAEGAAAGVPGFVPSSAPDPLAPTGPEPWGKPTGSQGMHKPTPGAAAPRQRPPAWLRSAPFAGGR